MIDKALLFFKNYTTRISVLILSILYYINQIFWGLDFTDSFYYINLFPGFKENPMIAGTLVIGQFWTEIFGNSLISVRILSILSGAIALLLPYLCLIPKSEWKKNIYPLAFGFIFLRVNVYSPEGLTLLCISIAFICGIKYYQSQQLIYVLSLGIISALAVIMRFPNILLFPFIVCLLTLIEYVNNIQLSKTLTIKYLKTILFFLTVYISMIVLTSITFWGSIITYIDLLKSSISHSTTDSSHTLSNMIKGILNDLNRIILYIGLIFIIEFLLSSSQKQTTQKGKNAFIMLAFVLYLYFMVTEIARSAYNWNLMLFFSASVLFIIMKDLSQLNSVSNIQKVIFYFTVIGLAFVGPMGSNTGLLKLAPYLLIFLPIILYYSTINLSGRTYLIPMAIITVFFVLFSYTLPNEDRRIWRLKETVNTESRLKYIKTTPERVKIIRDVIDEYNLLEDEQNVVFFGGIRHIFYYLTNIKPKYPGSFWMVPDDDREVIQFKKTIDHSRPTIFVLTHYPFKVPYQNGSSKLEEMLIENGYKKKNKEQYEIYYYDE